ncbi:hypothetical protein FA15DRAFT_558779, partial [Coprinopsis marcescibilis]
RMEAMMEQTETKHSQMTALLDVRTAELKGTQTFLVKADLFSGGDVIRLVEMLNQEIFQCCAWVAETVLSEENIPKDDERVVEDCRATVEKNLGRKFRRLLEKNLATVKDPLILQTALQVTLVSYCLNLLVNFDLTNESVNKMLTFIYEQACAKG